MRHISAGVLEHCFSHSNLTVKIVIAMSRDSSCGEDDSGNSGEMHFEGIVVDPRRKLEEDLLKRE